MHAWQRRLIDEIILYCGKRCHSSTKACPSSASVLGWIGLLLICISKASQRCSIGFRSGLLAGHGSVWMLLLFRWPVVSLAAWGVALSCMKIVPGFTFTNGSTWGSMIWAMYRAAVRFPCTICRAVLLLYDITTQTITLPPLCLSLSSMQFGLCLSPRRLYWSTFSLDAERGFVCKKKASPLVMIPVHPRSAPGQSGSFMTGVEGALSRRFVSLYAAFSKTISNSLSRDSSLV